jgi:hypothetical protein
MNISTTKPLDNRDLLNNKSSLEQPIEIDLLYGKHALIDWWLFYHSKQSWEKF